MKVAAGYPKTIEVDQYRYFGGKRFKWLDWTNTKRAANSAAKRVKFTLPCQECLISGIQFGFAL